MTDRAVHPVTTELESLVGNLLRTQPLAVLSTHGEGQPYSSLVAFAATPDLGTLLFATTRSTRKFRNLTAEPEVSLLVDNRSNREADFQDAVAVTAVGRAVEVAGADQAGLRTTYLAKHPYLEDFLVAPTCALVGVEVASYYVVQQFKNVRVFHPTA